MIDHFKHLTLEQGTKFSPEENSRFPISITALSKLRPWALWTMPAVMAVAFVNIEYHQMTKYAVKEQLERCYYEEKGHNSCILSLLLMVNLEGHQFGNK